MLNARNEIKDLMVHREDLEKQKQTPNHQKTRKNKDHNGQSTEIKEGETERQTERNKKAKCISKLREKNENPQQKNATSQLLQLKLKGTQENMKSYLQIN